MADENRRSRSKAPLTDAMSATGCYANHLDSTYSGVMDRTYFRAAGVMALRLMVVVAPRSANAEPQAWRKNRAGPDICSELNALAYQSLG